MMEARLAGLERRVEFLLNWTGADEDGNWGKEASVEERLNAQQAIIVHLVRHLEMLVPDFSVESLRRGMHMIDDRIESVRGASLDLSPELTREFKERRRAIIDDHLPKRPASKRRKFQPTLVPKGPGDPA
ncbi:hypothetical protein LH464_17250 [Neorhizobium sp. T786]|nr:hypothetical protein [Neorhizobium xiangyangii]